MNVRSLQQRIKIGDWGGDKGRGVEEIGYFPTQSILGPGGSHGYTGGNVTLSWCVDTHVRSDRR